MDEPLKMGKTLGDNREEEFRDEWIFFFFFFFFFVAICQDGVPLSLERIKGTSLSPTRKTIN